MKFTDNQILEAALNAYRSSLNDAGIEKEQLIGITAENDDTYNRYLVIATYHDDFYQCDIDIKAYMQIFHTEYRNRIIIDIFHTLGDQDMYLYDIDTNTGDVIDADTGEIRATIK